MPGIFRKESDADLCRARGWQVGTVLAGTKQTDAGPLTCRIKLLHVGQRWVLARCLDHAEHGGELLWGLGDRDWQEEKGAGPCVS